MSAQEPASLTDSPWFWVLMFSVTSLGALLAIGPKYGRRQTVLERNYQARERVAERLAAESDPIGAPQNDGPAQRREFASTEERLIPLWPLAALLGVVAAVAAAMLYRGRGRPGSLS